MSDFIGSGLKISALQCVAHNDTCSLRIICNLAQKNEYDLEQMDEYGNTALLKACYLARYEAVEILLEFGANVKATNFFGQNALTLAAYAGSLRTVRKLLRYRSYADFNLASITPALCIATMHQDKRLIEYFQTIDRNRSEHDDICTVHGLTKEDIDGFVQVNQHSEKKLKLIHL